MRAIIVRLAALVALLAGTAPAHAERGHSAYEQMINRERTRDLTRRFAQLCKPVGVPLLAIERRVAGLLVSRVVLYPTGAWTATTWDGLDAGACVKGRVMDHLRDNLYALDWKSELRQVPCTTIDAVSPIETHYWTRGRKRFVEHSCGPALRAEDSERVIDTEAILLALIRGAR